MNFCSVELLVLSFGRIPLTVLKALVFGLVYLRRPGEGFPHERSDSLIIRANLHQPACVGACQIVHSI